MFMYKTLYKKIFVIILLMLIFCLPILSNVHSQNIVNIDNSMHIAVMCDVSNDIDKVVDDQLNGLDEEGFDNILDKLTQEQKDIFGQVNITEKIKDLISGKGLVGLGDVLSFVLSILIDNLKGILPILTTICAIAIVGNILLQIRGKTLDKPLGDIIHFACYTVVVLLVITSVLQLVQLTTSTLNLLKSQMEVVYPLLLTVMAGLGAGASVSIYQPIVAILCGVMMQLFLNIVLPLFALSTIFGVVGNMSSTVKLTKMADFFKNLFKYVIGFTFTIFSAILAVSGIMAGSFDGISIRATKFAIKSYIPFVGGYLTDGFSLIMASSVLIKNAIGYSGLVVMFLTIASPLLKIFLFKLGLNLLAGVIEPVADSRITSFISQTAKNLSMLSSVILAFTFSYLISVGLMMCTANIL